MKMLENSGFEKQLVTNSLSASSLSLAVLSTLWKTCIHYLSVAPQKQQLHACVTAICFASANRLGGVVLYRKLYINPERCVSNPPRLDGFLVFILADIDEKYSRNSPKQ